MSARVTVTMTAMGPNMGRVSYTREALLADGADPVGMDDAVARVADEARRARWMLLGCQAGLDRHLARMSGEALGLWDASSAPSGGGAA
ncbi:hypothetical protein [Actinomyces gaoshouyii]|uniref:hypothetical protein n=1 Tax=Actinomyces gaoshouyii TaxID=1960083 RepID=UPI0009C0F536|nr:hypothetical protein [Actinomyces gaoshouyii]ARD42466.1 hypothetical protein B6G06_09060 [Actinomyces gaoshouyii]